MEISIRALDQAIEEFEQAGNEATEVYMTEPALRELGFTSRGDAEASIRLRVSVVDRQSRAFIVLGKPIVGWGGRRQ